MKCTIRISLSLLLVFVSTSVFTQTECPCGEELQASTDWSFSQPQRHIVINIQAAPRTPVFMADQNDNTHLLINEKPEAFSPVTKQVEPTATAQPVREERVKRYDLPVKTIKLKKRTKLPKKRKRLNKYRGNCPHFAP